MSTLQVDRIIPYLSASVTIEGAIQANAATTGSNTFTGDQNILGTLTASLQEGYAWVGGVGNISTLVATSSFGGGGSGFPFTGDAVITGSLTISGSSLFDVTLEGRQQIIGGTTGGSTPQLLISSSDFNVLYGRTGINLRKADTTFNGNLSRGGLQMFEAPGTPTTLLISNFDEPNYNDNVDLYIEVEALTGIKVQDWDNSTFAYDDIFTIGVNVGTTPDVEFKRSVQVTGSVEISSVMQLAGQDPLPAGGVGQLAVSASNLYYHNGSSWSQIN